MAYDDNNHSIIHNMFIAINCCIIMLLICFVLCCHRLKSDDELNMARAEWKAKEVELQNSLQKEKDAHVRFEGLQDSLKKNSYNNLISDTHFLILCIGGRSC